MDVPVLSDALRNDDEAEFFRQLAKTRIQARLIGMSDLDGTNPYFIPDVTLMYRRSMMLFTIMSIAILP